MIEHVVRQGQQVLAISWRNPEHDQTVLVLASWLLRIGYRAHTCGFVTNLGCADRALERVERRLARLGAHSGRRVARIGHSRGGHYARALAVHRPELVSHAISVSAGLRQMLATSYPTPGRRRRGPAGGVAERPRTLTTVLTETRDCGFARDFTATFPTDGVRLTSIYSKGDGVVRWQAALVSYGNCVEVTGSHVGLVFNRKTYRTIATALAEPEPPSGGS
jgi:pimeloyl-ACP methyl ester carboxylesterase